MASKDGIDVSYYVVADDPTPRIVLIAALWL